LRISARQVAIVEWIDASFDDGVLRIPLAIR
jgi:hypothetical protein